MSQLPEVIVYTDGACSGNPGPGGWGALLIWKGKEKELSGGEPQTTNNRMEMRAVIEAARQVGLNVPNQVSVIGNCSAIYACDGYPRLSAVHRDVSAIIEHAIDMLKQCIADPKKDAQSLKIVPKLAMRQTVGKVESDPS